MGGQAAKITETRWRSRTRWHKRVKAGNLGGIHGGIVIDAQPSAARKACNGPSVPAAPVPVIVVPAAMPTPACAIGHDAATVIGTAVAGVGCVDTATKQAC